MLVKQLNKYLFLKSHLTFLVAIPFLLLYGYINKGETSILSIHDTYFVATYVNLSILFSILFGVFGIIYLLMKFTNKKPIKWLFWMHLIITFGGFFCLYVLTHLYREDSVLEYQFNSGLDVSIACIKWIIIFGQLLFPINLICSLWFKNND